MRLVISTNQNDLCVKRITSSRSRNRGNLREPVDDLLKHAAAVTAMLLLEFDSQAHSLPARRTYVSENSHFPGKFARPRRPKKAKNVQIIAAQSRGGS
jgi:hypothetical protein